VCVGYFFWFQVDKILHLSLSLSPTEKIENVRKKNKKKEREMLQVSLEDSLRNSQSAIDRAFDAFGRERQERTFETLREDEEKTNHLEIPLCNWHFRQVSNAHLRKTRDLSTFVHSYIRPRSAPSPKRNYFSASKSSRHHITRQIAEKPIDPAVQIWRSEKASGPSKDFVIPRVPEHYADLRDCRYITVRRACRKLKWRYATATKRERIRLGTALWSRAALFRDGERKSFNTRVMVWHQDNRYGYFVSSNDKRNHFPKMNSLTSKSMLVRNLMRMKRIMPSEYAFVPDSWVMPLEKDKLKVWWEENKDSNPTFICKPSSSSSGRGIIVTKDMPTPDLYVSSL